MNNSRWKANRVGLIDFWYYDEEEFSFLDGRMLLRGSNGSGKSVTMQSFLPLILDGNMRPERLDPFGSRARKMENYLLEDGDEREERTAYLYMELKREEEEIYHTLGIGMKARKNKKMEVWYFAITDGRRIGKEFALYKDGKNKITYTKLELKNRLADGGKVFETQKEYMDYVNKTLFGFDTIEEYKEMLDLLIQLRTPKLSKDFKPTIINEILSNSLQTLSEEDLRPISEAIENMDNLATNLESLKEGYKAAKQIQRVYQQYNQCVLYNKASNYLKQINEHNNVIQLGKEYQEKIEQCSRDIKQQEEEYETLSKEEKALQKEKNELDNSDVASLKEQEIFYQKDLDEGKASIEQKETQYAKKNERRIELANRYKRTQEENEKEKSKIQEKFQEIDEYMEGIPFDEYQFLKNDLLNDADASIDFDSHKSLFLTYKEYVQQGLDRLKEEYEKKKLYDELLLSLDKTQKDRDKTERELRQYENQLLEAKEELKENFYRWKRNNVLLKPEDEVMKQVVDSINGFYEGSDYLEIKDLVRKTKEIEEGKLREENYLEKEYERKIKLDLKEKEEQLEQWNNKKDPEPECDEGVKENRRRLQEKNIPYQQFYKVVDFDSSVTEEEKSMIEEALLSMGILDALIIAPEYKEYVLAMEEGSCDKYIFSDVQTVKDNFTKVLHADILEGESNRIEYLNITSAIQGIGYGKSEANTWIDSRGNYQIGIVEGTVTKEYTAKYIGVHAREQFRLQQIQRLECEIEEIRNQLQASQERMLDIENRSKILQQEWDEFPSGDDLKSAAKSCVAVEEQYEKLNNQLLRTRIEVEKQRNELETIRLQVASICSKSYLKPNLNLFEETMRNLNKYSQDVLDLNICHERYKNGLVQEQSDKEAIEEIDQDIDDVLYDLGKQRRKQKEIEEILKSIQQQLSLTNYEEIKERFNFCMQRLEMIPKQKEDAIRTQASLVQQKEELERKLTENREKEEVCRSYVSIARELFFNEYELGYVFEKEELEQLTESSVKNICRKLETQVLNRTQNDLFGSLQEVYHRNKGNLIEYQLTMLQLFNNENDNEIFQGKRIDIVGKYRGISINFRQLVEKLEQDMNELEALLNDKDRELFQDILANTISKKIRARIQLSKRWVENMNQLMESMNTSSGLRLSLRWKNKKAEKEGQIDTKELVDLLQKDSEIMREDEIEKLSKHFRSKIQEARVLAEEKKDVMSLHVIMKEILDYRKWFEFQLESQKTGERKKELTDRVFFTFSGGEKAMAMYVPLFSAVAAKYDSARKDAPRLISLDEAFAGVDEMNIKDMFRLMIEFGFDFMLNSQILWGDYNTVPSIAIYQLVRPENVKYVTVISYVWNGKVKVLKDKVGDSID